LAPVQVLKWGSPEPLPEPGARVGAGVGAGAGVEAGAGVAGAGVGAGVEVGAGARVRMPTIGPKSIEICALAAWKSMSKEIESLMREWHIILLVSCFYLSQSFSV